MKLTSLMISMCAFAACIAAQTPSIGNSPNTTVFIGDSITAAGDAQYAPANSYGWGWTAQAVFLSNGRIQQLYNAGVAGQTTSSMAARFATDVVARNPGTVVIMGGTNDASTGALSSTALAATIANLQSMVDAAKAAGIQPIICTIPPRNDGTNYNQNAQMINVAIHKLAQSERIMLVDFYSVLADSTTGQYKSGYVIADGIHPSSTGAKAMAQYFVTATANLFGPSQEISTVTNGDATNLISNPLFLYSINSWSSNGYGTSPAPTYSVVADTSISGNWLSFSFPAATAAGQMYAVNGPAATTVAGHNMAYSFKFQITGLEENGGSLNMGYAWGASNFTYGYVNDTAGTFYMEFVAPSTTFIPGFFVYPTVTAQPITLKIAQMSLVDLTALGY